MTMISDTEVLKTKIDHAREDIKKLHPLLELLAPQDRDQINGLPRIVSTLPGTQTRVFARLFWVGAFGTELRERWERECAGVSPEAAEHGLATLRKALSDLNAIRIDIAAEGLI